MKRAGERAANERRIVMDAIEDRILETHHLLSVSDIEREVGSSMRRALDELIADRSLLVLYEGSGLPRVVAPAYMFDDALRLQRKPSWVRDLSMPSRAAAEAVFNRDRKEIHRLDVLERLLYATGDPLEEAVATALVELDFADVVWTRRPDQCDVRFADGSRLFLVEAKGKTKQADKDDVLQLSGWIDDAVELGTDPDDLAGVLVANHFRHEEPARRGPPLTDEAQRLAKRHKFGVWTSIDLYERLRQLASSGHSKEQKERHRTELLAKAFLEGRRGG